MELYVRKGCWGLPSNDVACLQVMAYCKFSGAPVNMITSEGINQLIYNLPYFKHGSKVTLTEFTDILSHLRKQNYCADFDLSPKQCSDVLAYRSFLKNSLYPAILYMLWMDSYNYSEVIRPWCAKILPFPFKFFIPGQLQRAAIKTVYSVYDYKSGDFIQTDNEMEAQVYKKAGECITLLSERLGDNEFFFGKSPCSVDALVFGYLAIILKSPVPNAALQNYLKNCENLSRFVERILQKYFPPNTSESEKEEQIDFPHKWRNIILSTFAAGAAMIGYAFLSGIVSVEIVDDGDTPAVEERQEFEDKNN